MERWNNGTLRPWWMKPFHVSFRVCLSVLLIIIFTRRLFLPLFSVGVNYPVNRSSVHKCHISFYVFTFVCTCGTCVWFTLKYYKLRRKFFIYSRLMFLIFGIAKKKCGIVRHWGVEWNINTSCTHSCGDLRRWDADERYGAVPTPAVQAYSLQRSHGGSETIIRHFIFKHVK